jgi:hypothetical protein
MQLKVTIGTADINKYGTFYQKTKYDLTCIEFLDKLFINMKKKFLKTLLNLLIEMQHNQVKNLSA